MTATDKFVEGILQGRDRRIGANLLRGILTLFSWLYQSGLWVYLALYKIGVLKRERLPVPVLSIGNITSGGTGKTPTAVLVAGYLQRSGKRVVILSRGHGRQKERRAPPQIVSDGTQILLSPEVAGDEPVLLARLLPGVPVIVGKDRRRSGRLAVEMFAPDVIVLDDALQFWQLHRDLDIVLIDAHRPFDNSFLLPRGLLREPVSHLSRAGLILLTRTDQAEPETLAPTATKIARYAPNALLFQSIHAPKGWLRVSDNHLLPTDALRGQRVVLFSGIASGGGFAHLVDALGATVVDRYDFGDHHHYTEGEIQKLMQLGREVDIGIEAFVTTEKDLVKVGTYWNSTDAVPPLYALRIGIELKTEEGSGFWEKVEAVLLAYHK